MGRIKLGNWYVKENSLSILFMRFYVWIYPLVSGNKLSYAANIMDDDNNRTLYFDDLDDAVAFTERVIKNANSIEEIMNEYKTIIDKPKEYRK